MNMGRFGGALAGVRPDDLAAHALKALLARAGDLVTLIDPDDPQTEFVVAHRASVRPASESHI